jgi:hypothetical protein
MYTNFQEQAVRLDRTIDWMYTNYKERDVRTVFETAGGTVFIGSNNSLFRSTNSGKTWKQVHVGDGRMKLVESNGVLLTTSKDGILRSTDDGQNWDRVISEGGAWHRCGTYRWRICCYSKQPNNPNKQHTHFTG